MSRPKPIEEMVRLFKIRHTTSHLFKIDNFSLFEKHRIDRIETSVFNLAGHKWKLVVYPNGYDETNSILAQGYVSMYLLNIYPVNDHPLVELFVVNQLWEDKWHSHGKWAYSTLSGLYWKGYSTFISRANLERNGYLIDDCCMFGVKFHGTELAKSGTGECLSLIEKPLNHKVTWMMTKFSSFGQNVHQSNEFVVGNRKWEKKDKSFSVYLVAEEFFNNTPKVRNYVRFKLRVLDQVSRNHVEKTVSAWLGAEPDEHLGLEDFMPLGNLREPYLVNDKLYVGVDFEVISIRNYL